MGCARGVGAVHPVGPRLPPRRRSVGSISTPSDSLIESATTMEASLPALGGMLKDRCADEKATVRRSALSALESWARASGLLMNAAQLKVIQQRCVAGLEQGEGGMHSFSWAGS